LGAEQKNLFVMENKAKGKAGKLNEQDKESACSRNDL